MKRIAPSGISVRPDITLNRFAREYLLSPSDWAELDRVKNAAKPASKTILNDGIPQVVTEPPSADYLRKVSLQELLRQKFSLEIGSGRWDITAIPAGEHNRQRIAPELVKNAKCISFEGNTVGRYSNVQVTESSAADRYLTLKWFIEQVCQVVPPKRGVGKEQLQDLAERLLEFDVRDDLFKSAWTDAAIPTDFRKPGR